MRSNRFRRLWITALCLALLLAAWFLWHTLSTPSTLESNREQIPTPTSPIPKQPDSSAQSRPISPPPQSTDLDSTPQLAFVSGLIQASSDRRFAQLSTNYANDNIYVQTPVAEALKRMIDAAKQEGIELRVVSGFRSHPHQLTIWQRKWDEHPEMDDISRVAQILRYSSLPGISRHHWGTDVDLNSTQLNYWQTEQAQAELRWLRQHAPTYGFCEPYSGKSAGTRAHGYEDEPWHWSYRALAQPLQQLRSQTIDSVFNQAIPGQAALSHQRTKIEHLVNGIARTCQ